MPNFIPTDEQWEKMKRHIKGDNYKKEDFFVFETLAVGDKIVPNRYMRLTPELLQVMRDDAEKGVSLMLNHNWSQTGVQSIPIGKVFDGRIAGSSQNGENTVLYTTQYILRDDSKVDGYSKNDIIKLIESGILADTSVGWGTTRESYKCNICGNSIYDYRKCEHIPGKKYIVNEETNEVKECIVEACPPHELHVGNNVLMENSIVFDGAYPNAIIQSAVGDEIETPNGFKKLEEKEELSIKDFIVGFSSTGGAIHLMYKPSFVRKGGLEQMENENQEVQENTETQELNNQPENAEVTPEAVTEELNNETEETTSNAVSQEVTPEATQEAMYTEKDILNKFDNICESVEELITLAKEGLSNRKEVISQALESGVHSMGNAFDKEIFTKTFESMKTADIKQMANAWEKQAEMQFVKNKVSKQDFSNAEESEEIKVDMTQFKTSNY